VKHVITCTCLLVTAIPAQAQIMSPPANLSRYTAEVNVSVADLSSKKGIEGLHKRIRHAVRHACNPYAEVLTHSYSNNACYRESMAAALDDVDQMAARWRKGDALAAAIIINVRSR